MTATGTAQLRAAVMADKVRLGFVASPAPEAQAALKSLSDRYGDVDPQTADAVIALGGDGLMLQTLHRFMGMDVPIYGMHRGSVGFLMNEYPGGRSSGTGRAIEAECDSSAEDERGERARRKTRSTCDQ